MDRLQCLQILRSGHHLQLHNDPRLLPGPPLPSLPHAHLHQLASVGKGMAWPCFGWRSQDICWATETPWSPSHLPTPPSCTIFSRFSPEFPTVWWTSLSNVPLLSKTHLPSTTRLLPLTSPFIFSGDIMGCVCACVCFGRNMEGRSR